MRRRDAAAALALVAALFSAVPARALRTERLVSDRGVAVAGAAGLPVTSGQALVRLSSGTAPASLDGALAALGAARGADLGGGWTLVTWSGAGGVAQKLAALRTVPGVADAQPSRVYSVRRAPSDPQAINQYALSAVDAYGAWDYETGTSSRVTVALIDTGIDSSHPDLSPKLAGTTSAAFDPNTGAPSANEPSTPACNHATHAAGIAAAATDNHFEVAGMSWGAQLVSYKVFSDADCTLDCSDAAGGGGCLTNDVAIIAALNRAASLEGTAAYGRIVANMSLGGAGSCAAALQTAVNGALAAGVVVVAAAGNDGLAVNSPGNCVGVIPAGATDSNNQVASFSSRGAELSSGGLVAPGVSVLTTDVGGGLTSATGTSFSAPMVSGAAALLLSAKPALTPAQVQANLRSSAKNLGYASTVQGAGLLDAYAAVYLALYGGLPAGNSGAGAVAAEEKSFAFPNPLRLSETSRALISVPPSYTNGPIEIYTLDGKFVREVRSPVWDGTNANGGKVATGTYVIVVKTSKGTSTGRMTVIR